MKFEFERSSNKRSSGVPTTKHSTCGEALWNTEVMNRRLQVVENRVASFPIPEVFVSKIKFLKVKWSIFKTFNFYLTLIYREKPKLFFIEVFKLTRFDLRILQNMFTFSRLNSTYLVGPFIEYFFYNMPNRNREVPVYEDIFVSRNGTVSASRNNCLLWGKEWLNWL